METWDATFLILYPADGFGTKNGRKTAMTPSDLIIGKIIQTAV